MMGPTYDPDRDGERLASQQAETHRFLQDGRWHTLAEITAGVSVALGRTCSDASISAKIRALRHPRHGGHDIQSRRVSGGTREYRWLPPGEPQQNLLGDGGSGTLRALR